MTDSKAWTAGVRGAGPWLAGAAALGASALYHHVRARGSEQEHPPTGRILEIDGVQLHYLERGKGSPVVLLHGNGAMIADYEISGVLDLAAERHRVIAFDRPGFGHSTRPRMRLWTPAAQAELISDALDELGVEKAVIVGHSWGTLVALALALEHRDRVKGLVLLSGYYFPTLRADVPLFSPPAIPVVGDVMRYTISPVLARVMAPGLIARMFEPRPVSPRFEAEFPVDMTTRPSQIRASAEETAFMVPAAAGFEESYPGLDIQTIIIAGSDDKIADVDRQSTRLSQELPRAELQLVAGAGHMVHHAAPERVAAAIEQLSRQPH